MAMFVNGNIMTPIQKYPRTQHIAGSGIQAGDAGILTSASGWPESAEVRTSGRCPVHSGNPHAV